MMYRIQFKLSHISHISMDSYKLIRYKLIRVIEDGYPHVRYLKLQAVENANADGLVAALDSAFADFGFTSAEWKVKLVGFGADGAAVNLGVCHSVSTMLRSTAPWMIQIHCMAHRLELALKDCFKDTHFQRTIVETLTTIYYFYTNSPKRLRELKTTAEKSGRFLRWRPTVMRCLQSCPMHLLSE